MFALGCAMFLSRRFFDWVIDDFFGFREEKGKYPMRERVYRATMPASLTIVGLGFILVGVQELF
jgi:hypothetical protein